MFHNRYFKNLQKPVNLYLSGQKKTCGGAGLICPSDFTFN